MTKSQIAYWIGLIGAICAAETGQAHVIPEPYDHVVSGIGIAATAICGYLIQPRQKEDT